VVRSFVVNGTGTFDGPKSQECRFRLFDHETRGAGAILCNERNHRGAPRAARQQIEEGKPMNEYVRTAVLFVFVASLCVAADIAGQKVEPSAEPQIVFVCEHGAAKSVIATAYFNKMAAERRLPDRAIYRGANPQAELSVWALKGLKDDGLTLPSDKPSPITSADVTAATHIFAIGCTLPTYAVSSGKADSWDDVPDDQGYAAQRDAIKKHVERLIEQLEKR
jgi:protein-tyrosine-phosphatase